MCQFLILMLFFFNIATFIALGSVCCIHKLNDIK